MDYQDVITYKEESVKIFDEEKADFFEDPRYTTIIKALRKGPMTVRDLEEEYNLIVTKQVEKMDLTKKEKEALVEKMTRKGKTLYKYLDALVKKGLVVEAGKRIRTGQTATETLYGRTARLFVLSNESKLQKIFAENEEVWDVIGSIIRREEGKEEIDTDCLKQAIEKINNSMNSARKDIFTKYSQELAELSPKITFEQLNEIALLLEVYYLISSASDLNKEFDKCFK